MLSLGLVYPYGATMRTSRILVVNERLFFLKKGY